MSKKIVTVVILSTLFMSVCVVPVGAKEASVPVPKEITPQKRALIAEFLKVSKVKELIDEGTIQMFDQVDRNYPQMLHSALAEAGMLENISSEKFREALEESKAIFSKKFREQYPKRVKIGEMIEKIYYPLYDEAFTEDDIKDLIKFYKSPAGQKSIKAMPKIMQGAMKEFGKRLNPEIIHLVTELMNKEKEAFLVKVKKQTEKQGEEKGKDVPDNKK